LFSNAIQVSLQIIQLCVDIDEKTVLRKAFDLVLSFDDVVTLGYRESVTMGQLDSYLEMDSTDEKIYKLQ
jgi:coatomer subunit delta